MTTQRTIYAAAVILLFVLFASRMRYQEKAPYRPAGLFHPVQASLPAGRAPEISPGNSPGFFENKGQAGSPQRVRYTLEANGVTCYFTPERIVYAFSGTGHPGRQVVAAAFSGQDQDPDQKPAPFVTMSWQGANPAVRITAEDTAREVRNYYTTGDPEGITGVRGYRKIVYQELYPHIDLVLYTAGQGLKYDFVVRPGGNVRDIELAYDGIKSLSLDPSGELVAEAPQGRLREGKPYTYQTVNGAKTEISSRFRVAGRTVRFEVGAYDRQSPLVIDPTLLWATYYGGDNGESGNAVCGDSFGNVYLAGTTTSQKMASFNGYDVGLTGMSDAYLVKFDAAGNRLWATYYGGNKGEMGKAVCTDPAGNVYLAGYTESSTHIAHKGHDNTYNQSAPDGNRFDRDAFLVKFNKDGQRVWGTYYGGENYNGPGFPARGEEATGVCSDASGNIFLTGFSTSTTGIAHAGHDMTYSGSADAFLVKFTNGGTRSWATYFGTTGEDVANAVATDASNNVYIAGRTTSLGLGHLGHDVTYGGDTDAFLAKFSNTGTFYYATYYGGAGYDEALAVATYGNDAYLAGVTTSPTSIHHGAHDASYNGAQDAFLVKFNFLGNRQWGTYYGGAGKEFHTAMTVSKNGDVYLAGTTDSNAGIATAAGYAPTPNGNWDGYLARFTTTGVRVWGSYYGGPGGDYLGVVATDAKARVYVAGRTQSSMGIAKNGFQNALNKAGVGSIDAFLAKFEPYQATGIPTGSGDVTGGVAAAAGRLPAASGGDAPALQLHAYPNPASTSLRVSLRHAAEGPLRLEAYSPAGQRVYAGPVNGSSEATIDVSKWQKGVYVLKARTSCGSTTTKIIVQ
ncbi:MAG: SBBP repeat-containing protein [Cytophagales bacterium]|nr:SBBP repeat-containing protein [Cytophagales bacterium]